MIFCTIYNQKIMITLKCKKQKVLLKSTTKSTLKINSHLPILPNLNILKLTPPKFSLQKTPKKKSEKSLQNQDFGNISETSFKQIGRRQSIRSKSQFSLNININKPSSIKRPLQQEQVAQEQQNALINKSGKKLSSVLNVVNGTCQSATNILKEEQEDIQKMKRRLTSSTYCQIIKSTSAYFTICSVVNELIVASKASQSFKPQNFLDIKKVDQQTSTNQEKNYPDTEILYKDKIQQFNEMMSKNQRILEQKQARIMEAETQVAMLQLAVLNLKLKAQNYIDCQQKSLQMRAKMETFVENQPSQILKISVEGYRESIQKLFDLASILQYSTYQNMLQHLYQQIEIPEKSLFYVIQDFQTGARQENSVVKFKQKFLQIYNHIMERIRDILRLKSEKIHLFVHTLRNLASYTIDKRQYLNEINTKMVDLGVLSETYMLQIQPLLNSSPQNLEKLRSVIKSMRSCYDQAQIFY